MPLGVAGAGPVPGSLGAQALPKHEDDSDAGVSLAPATFWQMNERMKSCSWSVAALKPGSNRVGPESLSWLPGAQDWHESPDLGGWQGEATVRR